jgi:membrane fusion protein, multidrug efflux system
MSFEVIYRSICRVALVIAACCAGVASFAEDNADRQPPAPSMAPTVRQADPASKPLPAQDLGSKLRDIRIQIVARTSAILGAPMAGRLLEFPLRDGDRFKKDQLVARFDCTVQQGALARTRAVLEEKRHVMDTNQRLRQLGTSSGMEFGVAEAQLHMAMADVTTTSAIVEKCALRAPFSGRAASALVHENQFVTEGAPLIELLSDRELEVQMIVPSLWLSWLKTGAAFDIAVTETNRAYHAELTRISGKVDAVSQSINVYGRIIDPTDDLLPGMSGRALLSPPAGL